MREREPVFGTLLCVGVSAAALNEAMDTIIAHPNWIGAVVVVSIVSSTVFICRSIYRDRIA